jgi:hypothetical protein
MGIAPQRAADEDDDLSLPERGITTDRARGNLAARRLFAWRITTMEYTPDALRRALGDRHRASRYAFAGQRDTTEGARWDVCFGWIGAPMSRGFFQFGTGEQGRIKAERFAAEWITGGYATIADLGMDSPRWFVEVNGRESEERAIVALRWAVHELAAPIIGRIERYNDRTGVSCWRASLIVESETAPEIERGRNWDTVYPIEVSRYEKIARLSGTVAELTP